MSLKSRKQRPYVFFGQTTSLCETCSELVPAKIIFEEDKVYYQKRCHEHGIQKTLVSTDIDYFLQAKQFIKPGDRPLTVQSETRYGCPYDCGLCADHEQHSCIAIIEINEECNLACPVCYAESSPERKKNLSLEEFEFMLDALVASEGEPDILQISGGEPTLHPRFFEILDMARTRPVRHLMLNTNGVRIATDRSFVERLARYTPGFEVYLQFDSLRRDALQDLRGVNLSSTREQALAHLEEFGISTTLVVTVKKGVNDTETGAIIEYALQFGCVRGVTFQPIQDVGRNSNFDKNRDRVLLSEIRTGILESFPRLSAADIIPLPCNPESISVAYALRNGSHITPVTSLLPTEELVGEAPNSISFEKDTNLRQKVIDLFSLSSGDLRAPERMASLLCCLPEVPVLENLDYANVFRVAIIQFLDRFNFCIANVKRSCIHFVTPQGKIIPFDTFNLLYRNGLANEFGIRSR